MSIPKRKLREIVFQWLYSTEYTGTDAKAMRSLLMKELKVARSALREAEERVEKIRAHREEINVLLQEASEGFALDRIQSAEKSILHLAAYELLYDEEVPSKVALAEAVRLARKFSSPEAAGYVNAVLDHIYHQHQGEQGDPEAVAEAAAVLEQYDILMQETRVVETQEGENLEHPTEDPTQHSSS